MAAVHRYPEATISPDGARVAYVEQGPAADGATSAPAFVSDTTGAGTSRRIALGDPRSRAALRHLAWSADGRRLAFLSDAEAAGQLQLYVVAPGEGKPRRITTVVGSLAHPIWSPDGRSVAVLFTENARQPTGPTAAKTPEVGVIEEDLDVQRIAVVDLATRALRLVSPPGLYVHEYDWSRDGRLFVATAAPPPGDDGWYVSELLTVEAASGAVRSLVKPGLQIGCPRLSPDRRSVAFVGGLMSDEGVLGGDVFVVPVEGGEARNLTSGREASPSFLAWLPSSRELVFAEYAEGGSGVGAVGLDGRPPRTLWRGAERLSGPAGLAGPALSLARDGRTTAVVRQSFARPPEVWAGPVGEWTAITRANARVEGCWGHAESLSWTSEGRLVQGWLVHP
ncbi:MAG TPA: S9 family peptidase, partial [Vicinamibacteria bacterium]|nr:S9 family peptidase [Vicinamibacteria bacterium]